MYDKKDNSWKALPNLTTPRYLCAALIFGKQWIYAIAGYSSTYLNSVERLPITGDGNWCNVNIP